MDCRLAILPAMLAAPAAAAAAAAVGCAVASLSFAGVVDAVAVASLSYSFAYSPCASALRVGRVPLPPNEGGYDEAGGPLWGDGARRLVAGPGGRVHVQEQDAPALRQSSTPRPSSRGALLIVLAAGYM